jgi:3-methylcrotonyl-CoA carboxylase alpha subunit
MIRSLLIANRGEIACRVIRTAKRLGIRTIAVCSDADAKALHVRLADAVVRIGPSPARESYLAGDRILRAAHEQGAEAIHPGYGFLSENAAFAESVIRAGFVWVGAGPSSIKAMGLKDAAKKLMSAAGVPTTPGYLGEDQSLEKLEFEAGRIGYPVLVKAVAGGGGKGMRKVKGPADFADAVNSCQREAAAAFGNDRVLLEKWIKTPRHIEVQVFGDLFGNVVHLFERDCTLQRRHQKVIEEAPAPGMSEEVRAVVCGTAVQAARAVNYVGAGTVEFIADASDGLKADRIWFMEMNTRLQVEHPVTEMITGEDLVVWQLRIASGEPLPKKQDEIALSGWAMEARLYSENPVTGFLPSVGKLEVLALPETSVRVDKGVESGDEVSPYYDPMIAKLIAHGANRQAARIALANACDGVSTWPVRNNAGFLARLLRHEAFATQSVTTGFIDEHQAELARAPAISSNALSLAARHLVESAELQAPTLVAAAWKQLRGFRLNAAPDLTLHVTLNGETVSTHLQSGDTAKCGRCIEHGDGIILVENGWSYRIAPKRHDASDQALLSDGTITAPMPGRIVSLSVAEGEEVVAGQLLVTLEAMKMEHRLIAPFDGRVKNISVGTNAQVSEGALLLQISSDSNNDL